MAVRSRRERRGDATVGRADPDPAPDGPERQAVESQRRSDVEFRLRTALTAILGWADTLKSWQTLSPAQVDHAVAVLEARAADACRLAEDLVADIEAELSTLALHPVLVDLSALVESSVRPYISASSRHQIVLSPHLPVWLQVDPVAFRQVCAHLLENAIAQTPDGGTISVRISEVGGRAGIEISDEGSGAHDGVDMFAPLARAPAAAGQGPAGSGLGLHVVRRLAAAMGGEVGVRPNPGRGSTFTLALPAGRIGWPPGGNVAGWEAEAIAKGPMGLVCRYFAAPDEQSAAATVDWCDGPSAPPMPRRVFHHRSAPFATVCLDGIEPVVMIGRLEHLLTGRPLADVFHDQRFHQVATGDDGEQVVWGLSEALRNALATSDREQLEDVARRWSETEELSGRGEATVLAEQLSRLADLARTALEQGRLLFCWVSV